MQSIGIIGAGLSGLTAAKLLQNRYHVTLFEKSHKAGGRVASREANPYLFDHGAQFFIARSTAFKQFIQPMLNNGIIQVWNGRFVEFDDNIITVKRAWDLEYPHYVGVPTMNAIAAYLAQDLQIRYSTCVQQLQHSHNKWQLLDGDGENLGEFDWVIVSAPVAQTRDLIAQQASFAEQLDARDMQACFSLMLGFDQPLHLEFDAALVRGTDISWISVNSAKPGRSQPFSLLVHASNT